MEEFSGATPVSIEQEFYINMFYSNLCAIVKNDADEKIAASSRQDNQYRYQANRSFIIVSDFLKWPAFDLTDCPSIAHFSVRQRFNDTGADAPVQSNHFSR